MLELGLGLSLALSSPSTNIVASLLPNVTNCNTKACANDSTVSHLDEMQSLQLGPVFRTMGWIRTFLREFVRIQVEKSDFLSKAFKSSKFRPVSTHLERGQCMFTTKVRVWSDFCGTVQERSSIRSDFSINEQVRFWSDFWKRLFAGLIRQIVPYLPD